MASADLYKERIEVSLDGRQIFYMFVGGAVLACLVFVLGVMVGKRVESRSHLMAAQADVRRDPLAALDRVAASHEDLTFRQALRDQQQVTPAVDAQVTRIKAAEAAPAPTKPAGDALANGQMAIAAPVAPPPAVAKAAPAIVAPSAAVPTKPAVAASSAPLGKRYHTLRVSSFKQQAEADLYVKELRAKGYQPFTMAAVVDGEDWIRVCIGRHDTYEAAVDAKKKFEAKIKKIAYVLTVE